MFALTIILDVDTDPRHGDPALAKREIVHLPDPEMAFIRLPRGMTSGASSVMVEIKLPDGRVVLAETSMALFQQAAKAFAIADARRSAQGVD